MINYKNNRINLIRTNDEWNQLKSKVVLEALQKQEKLNQEEILKSAADVLIKETLESELKKLKDIDSKVYFSYEPAVFVNTLSDDKMDVEINISYYWSKDLENLQYKDIKMEFNFRELDNSTLEESFIKFTADYPVQLDIEEEIVEKDIVTVDFVVKDSEGKVLEENKNISLEAKNLGGAIFSINHEVLGKRVKQSFIGFDKGQNRTIDVTITAVKRPTRMKITDENLHLLKLENIKNMDEFKQRLFADYQKDNASDELLRYYNTIKKAIYEKNGIRFSHQNIRVAMANFIRSQVQKLPNYHETMVTEILNSDDPKTARIKKDANEFAVSLLSSYLIEDWIFMHENLTFDEKELLDFVDNFKDRGMFKSSRDYMQQIPVLLKRMKVALLLARENHPEFYNAIAKHFPFKLN